MKKKIAALMSVLLLTGLLHTSYVFAQGETKDSKVNDVNIEKDAAATLESVKTMELSMDAAVKLAKENSREMWKIDDGLKKLQEARKQGRTAKEQAEDLMSLSLEQLAVMNIDPTEKYVETLLAKNGYYITYADTQTNQLEKSKELLNLGLEIETKSLYYQVLLAEKSIVINESNLNKAKEQLRVINLKFNNGSATKAEVLNGEMAVHKAQVDIDSSKDDLEIAKLELLNKLNIPFDMEVIFTDKELNYVPTAKIDLNNAIEKAKLDRPEVLTAKNALELQKIETHAYTAYYTPNLREYKSAVEKLKDAELNIPQTYKSVELDVRKAYLNLVKAERALVNMDETIKLAKEASRVNKLLYENGMASSLNVLEADTNLAQAEIGRYQLLAAYNLSKLMFDNSNLMGSKVN